MADIITGEVLIKALSGISTNDTLVVPAGHMICGDIVVVNNNANAVTGGIKIGTTSGATDVVFSYMISANFLGFMTETNIAKRFFSKTVDQTLFINAITSWNSASVDIRIPLLKIF